LGVTRWLDRIDPATWERAATRVAERGFDLLEPATAATFLHEFGREPDHDILSSLDDADDEDVRPALLNSLLEAAVTEESWYLDKSFNRFAELAAVIPGGEALRKIIDFKGLDIEVPESCRMADSGLYGCCSSEALRECSDLAQRLATASEVQGALRQRRIGLFGRLLGRQAHVTSAVELMGQDYYANHWQTLCQAVLATTSRGHHLGLGMSP